MYEQNKKPEPRSQRQAIAQHQQTQVRERALECSARAVRGSVSPSAVGFQISGEQAIERDLTDSFQ